MADLLKHDKLLSKKAPSSHLRQVPEYLLDPTTEEASKIVKLSRAAMMIDTKKRRPGFKKGFGRSRDPLKTFSAEKSRKGAKRRKDSDEVIKHKKKKAKWGM